MKLYDGGRAPNPRRVRIFLAEKGITVPAEQLDLGALQHRTEAYTAINPMQRVPALVLDDGTVIAESIAICRYFEELNPMPALFGTGKWNRVLIDATMNLDYDPDPDLGGARGVQPRPANQARNGSRSPRRSRSTSCCSAISPSAPASAASRSG